LETQLPGKLCLPTNSVCHRVETEFLGKGIPKLSLAMSRKAGIYRSLAGGELMGYFRPGPVY